MTVGQLMQKLFDIDPNLEVFVAIAEGGGMQDIKVVEQNDFPPDLGLTTKDPKVVVLYPSK